MNVRYKKSLHYCELQKDRVHCSYVHRDLGRIHIARHDTAQAKENFERAYRLIAEARTTIAHQLFELFTERCSLPIHL